MYTKQRQKRAGGLQRWLRAVAMLCAVLLLVTVPAIPVKAETAAEKYERLQGELSDIAADLSESRGVKEKAEQERAALQREQQVLEEMIATKKDAIAESQLALEGKNAEISAKLDEIETNEALFRQRLVAMYKSNDANALSVILSVNSFSEMLQVVHTLQRVSTHDTKLLEDLATQKAALEQQKQDIDTLITDLNGDYDELNDNVDKLSQNIQNQNNTISQADADIKANEQAYGATEEEAAAAYAEMLALSNNISGMGSQPGEGIPGTEPDPAPEPAPPTDGGEGEGGGTSEPEPRPDPEPPAPPKVGVVNTWPVPASHEISCHFGAPDPNGRAHLGMDIRAPQGTTIVAAGDGVVITAGWHNSYGNYLVIDHGNGVKTLYAHCHFLSVGVGTQVTAGTAIAGVGTTGFSTGNHLHFEVHDGGRQNPLNYVS